VTSVRHDLQPQRRCPPALPELRALSEGRPTRALVIPIIYQHATLFQCSSTPPTCAWDGLLTTPVNGLLHGSGAEVAGPLRARRSWYAQPAVGQARADHQGMLLSWRGPGCTFDGALRLLDAI
jgi:hypothetical protein